MSPPKKEPSSRKRSRKPPSELPLETGAAADDTIFKEVDEELRRDRVVRLWRRYQAPVFIVAFLIVASVGAHRYYETSRVKTAEAANERYTSADALARDGRRDEAIAAFDALGKGTHRGYAALARLRAAEELAGSDKVKAMAAFDALAEDRTVDALMQDVARLRKGMLLLDGGDRQKMVDSFAPLMTSDGPFRYSAQELVALDAMNDGDYDEAERVFNLLTSDKVAPKSMRQRAAIYQSLLKEARAARPAQANSPPIPPPAGALPEGANKPTVAQPDPRPESK